MLNRRLKSISIIVGLLLGTFSGSCALVERSSDSQSESQVTKTSGVESHNIPGNKLHEMKGQEAVDFKDIQSLYNGGAYEAAVMKLGEYEKNYPNSKHMPYARNLHGLSYLLHKKSLQAVYQFKKALEISPNDSFKAFVSYNLAAAQAESNGTDESQKTLSEINPALLNAELRIKYHSLRARNFLKQSAFVDAAKESLILSRTLTEAQRGPPYSDILDQALQNISDQSALESLYKNYEDAPFADRVLFKLGSQEVSGGKVDAGEQNLRTLIAKFPKSPDFTMANQMLRPVQGLSTVDAKNIGVLLPIKGKFAAFGGRALQAVTLAFKIFEGTNTEETFNLVIRDSGEDAAQALKALNQLYSEDHAIAVIGPLLSKGVDQVTQRAQELNLPLITLAQQPGVPGEYIFQSGLTPKLQAQEIARYAIEKLGMRKFAILHPKDKFGEEYSQYYWDAVESLGGKIVGIEAYTPGETDFRHYVDRLSGLYYTEARGRELGELEKERAEQNIKKRNRKTEKFYALPPIVDYEAVFIPDEPKVIGQILPTFAFRDVDHVKFLGTSTWNSHDLVVRAQNFAEGSVFTDAFYPESESPSVQKFMESYKATYHQDPGAIEATAFDAASIVYRALLGKATNRSELHDRLKEISGYPGVTGKITYKDGQFSRNLTMLTVKNGQITEIH